MQGALAGRHALVTGGGRGIGAAIADALVAQGARVTLLGRDVARLEARCAENPGAMRAVSADVADPDAVAAAFALARQGFGPVSILVNNAGQAQSAPFLRTDLELWRRMIDVNLTGTMLCSQAALPGMLEAGWGRIVNVASTAALKGYAYVSAYCAAKHGVVGLTRALAAEVARSGVTVNAVCPGYTQTDLLSASIANVVARTGRDAEAARGMFAASNPQGRVLEPGEVAQAVLWLCLPSSSAVHGQSIAVCGGEVTP
ncbi:MAG: SDR family NAD(P)-dependent oxidoreductase [Alphaproteobacteria bacterium]